MMDSVRARRARVTGTCVHGGACLSHHPHLSCFSNATTERRVSHDEQQQSDGVQGAAEATVSSREADVRALPLEPRPWLGFDLPRPLVTVSSPPVKGPPMTQPGDPRGGTFARLGIRAVVEKAPPAPPASGSTPAGLARAH